MREGKISSAHEEIHLEASGPPRNHSGTCHPGAHASGWGWYGAGSRNRVVQGHLHLAGRHQATRGRMSLPSPVMRSPISGLRWPELDLDLEGAIGPAIAAPAVAVGAARWRRDPAANSGIGGVPQAAAARRPATRPGCCRPGCQR
jgi:hypothetical protein